MCMGNAVCDLFVFVCMRVCVHCSVCGYTHVRFSVCGVVACAGACTLQRVCVCMWGESNASLLFTWAPDIHPATYIAIALNSKPFIIAPTVCSQFQRYKYAAIHVIMIYLLYTYIYRSSFRNNDVRNTYWFCPHKCRWIHYVNNLCASTIIQKQEPT